MTAAEARKQRWESLKDKPLKDKLQYIFSYYWPGILGGVCVLVFLVSWIGNILTQKDVMLAGHLLNGMPQSSYTGDLRQDFINTYLDSSEQDFRLTMDNSTMSDSPLEVYEGMNAIVTRMAADDIEFLIGDLPSFSKFTAYYMDLRDVLSEEQLEKWSDLLVYVEKEALDILTSDELAERPLPEYFMHAEGLKDPIPLGIRLPKGSKLLQAYSFPKGEIIFGIAQSYEHPENILAFLEYILN